MSQPIDLTADELRARLFYDSATGRFTWLKPRIGQVIGDTAGRITDEGYIEIGIRRKYYKAHRLAFLYMTGEWPRQTVDHKNGFRADNSWPNLREADASRQSQNSRLSSANTSGYKGVRLDKKSKKWVASIGLNKTKHYLGSFHSVIEAANAYAAAAEQMFGEFACVDRQDGFPSKIRRKENQPALTGGSDHG